MNAEDCFSFLKMTFPLLCPAVRHLSDDASNCNSWNAFAAVKTSEADAYGTGNILRHLVQLKFVKLNESSVLVNETTQKWSNPKISKIVGSMRTSMFVG